MARLLGFPSIVAALMAMAWVSSLGGSRLVWVSGVVIFCLNFWIVAVVRRCAESLD